MSIFKDKTLLISGGTGSFGNAVLKRFLRTDIGEIRIFFTRWEESGWYAARVSGEVPWCSSQDQVLHRRCKKSWVLPLCNSWYGFYFPCCGLETGAQLWVLPRWNTSVSKLTSSPSIQYAITVTSIAQPVAHSPKIGQHWTLLQRCCQTF